LLSFFPHLISKARAWAPWGRRAAGAALLAALAACSTVPRSTAPANSDAYYRVKEGDTLLQISRRYKQSTYDLIRWNKLSNANEISTGMLLRVQPPFHDASTKGHEPPPSHGDNRSVAKPAPYIGSAAPAAAPVHGIALIWPAQGKLLASYNGSSSRGLVIAGQPGSSVVAAASGTVAYANSGLRGYGKMVIIRHEHNFLTIYAHNSKLLVKQGERVKQGQRIAEMGNTDARRVELYFELRRGGQPVNPMGVLPRR
jgi:murein DD-endopeptidase MepM/ murein hydrolase activator NlpD